MELSTVVKKLKKVFLGCTVFLSSAVIVYDLFFVLVVIIDVALVYCKVVLA